MARCKGCPALKADPAGVGVIEFYSCGEGCPDEDFDFYGGDCVGTNFPPDDEDEYEAEVLAYEMERDYVEG